MAKFNEKIVVKPDAVSYEGADVYKRDEVQAWFNFLFSSFLEKQYYESSNSQITRFIKLTEAVANKYGYTFVAKAIIFARNELGMRSVSHLAAAWLNDKSFQEKRQFYKMVMRRPDDVSEIFAAVDYLKNKRSHALINGSRDCLETLDDYRITKYKMIDHKYNMYDLINLTHANSETINAFKHDKLNSPDTWENKVLNAGSKENRKKEWRRLVEEGKLGYMALIRNLNNILDSDISSSWIEEYLIPQLTNENKIKKSLVFPYQVYTASKALKVENYEVLSALGKAFRIATSNVSKFDGLNAIILDVSGSMEDRISKNSNVTLKEVGACFAATLILNGSDVDFIKFGTRAARFNFNALDNPFSLIKKMCANNNLGYGTYLDSAYDLMKKDYSRIFLISDMQIFNSWWGTVSKTVEQKWHKDYHNINTYSFDLANYSNQLLSPKWNNLIYLTSLNDSIFKFVDILDGDLVNIINNYVSFN